VAYQQKDDLSTIPTNFGRKACPDKGMAYFSIVNLMSNPNLKRMNKSELIDAIAAETKMTKADSGRALDSFISSTTKALKKGDRVALVGFGTFSIPRLAKPFRSKQKK
jgi:hypothetical protein